MNEYSLILKQSKWHDQLTKQKLKTSETAPWAGSRKRIWWRFNFWNCKKSSSSRWLPIPVLQKQIGAGERSFVFFIERIGGQYGIVHFWQYTHIKRCRTKIDSFIIWNGASAAGENQVFVCTDARLQFWSASGAKKKYLTSAEKLKTKASKPKKYHLL